MVDKELLTIPVRQPKAVAMTECNTPTLEFSGLGRRRVVADFTGGDITSDAGLLLLREADKQIRLLDRLDAAVADPRDPERITHEQKTLLAQRVFAIAAGYEDLNDHDTLRLDPLLQTVVDRGPDGASPLGSDSTLCRLENRITRADLFCISEVFVDTFVASYDAPPDELVLDVDPSFDKVHGEQVGRFFHAYYGGYGFLPLHIFCGHRLLVSHLRTANGDQAKHVLPILRMLVRRLRHTWPQVRITVRADAGLCRPLMHDWCDKNDVSYVLGLGTNAKLTRLASDTLQAAADRFAVRREAFRVFGEFQYAAGTWSRERRVVVKGEHIPDANKPADRKSNPRYVVTNLPHPAQASRLLLSSAAYVLFEHMRRKCLSGTELETAQVSTIRNRLLKIGASVIASVRRSHLRLSGAFPLRTLLAGVLRRLVSPAAPTSPTALATAPSG